MYHLYLLNTKSLHQNLQENTNKITNLEELSICFISDLNIDKLFSISSDDEFVKTDTNNNNSQLNYISKNNSIIICIISYY